MRRRRIFNGFRPFPQLNPAAAGGPDRLCRSAHNTQLQWLRENWTAGDYVAAKESLRASMLEYRKDSRSKQQAPAPAVPTTASCRVVQPPLVSHAASSQISRLARFHALSKSLSGSDFDAPASPAAEMSESEKAEAERLAEIEINQFEAEGIMDETCVHVYLRWVLYGRREDYWTASALQGIRAEG
ncbi:hypothetical protein DFH07DRAFT_768705 [Mycena maculata]|uniref:Uncharacterized protein n=1 Tax=Mycena maculata TaxID=230809 RepID=A0AAD7JR44_9AGAR|nr:hypothetical protein DFH07DRAFT_768705 [Mycena maculata]